MLKHDRVEHASKEAVSGAWRDLIELICSTLTYLTKAMLPDQGRVRPEDSMNVIPQHPTATLRRCR